MGSNDTEDFALTMFGNGGRGTFWEYLGCKPVSLSKDEAIAEIDIQAHHLNVMGAVHGGVYASLLDSVMGSLALYLRPGMPVVTSNLNLHFTAPVKEGTIRAVARTVHESARTLTVEGRVLNAAGDLCAYASGTFRMTGSRSMG